MFCYCHTNFFIIIIIIQRAVEQLNMLKPIETLFFFFYEISLAYHHITSINPLLSSAPTHISMTCKLMHNRLLSLHYRKSSHFKAKKNLCMYPAGSTMFKIYPRSDQATPSSHLVKHLSTDQLVLKYFSPLNLVLVHLMKQ